MSLSNARPQTNPPAVIAPGLMPPYQALVGMPGFNPDTLLEEFGLIKAERERGSPGVAGGDVNVARGIVDAYPYFHSARGVRENLPPVPYRVCRTTRKKNPPIAAVVNLRRRQQRAYTKPSVQPDDPGYTIQLKDRSAKPGPQEREEMKWLEEFFQKTGRSDFDGWEEREDTLHSCQTKMAEDYLTIDTFSSEIRRDRDGDAVDFLPIDSATIKRMLPGGWRGDRADFDPRMYVPWDALDMASAMMKITPDVKKIKYVQEIQGRFVVGFTARDLVFDVMNERTDVYYHGYGYPLVEQAISVITAFMHALQYNAQAFDTGTIPKIALIFKKGNFGEQQLMRFQDQWIANFRGNYGAWRIPMINADAQVVDLVKSPRDMEYGKYMELSAAMIFAIFGADPAEVGLKLMAGGPVLNENQEAKLKWSKDRGLHDLLGQQASFFNKMLLTMDTVKIKRKTRRALAIKAWEKYEFAYTGLNPADLDALALRNRQRVETHITINELRAESDMEPLPDGDIILNPVYLQAQQMKQQAEQAAQQQSMGGGMDQGGGNGGGFDDMGGFDQDGSLGQMMDQGTEEIAGALTKAGAPARTCLL